MTPLHINTPLIKSEPLSRILGAPVWLKMDALQPTGSFKIRGIGKLCEEAHRAGAKRLISSSGGNAGYAVAYAGRRIAIPVTVVVPKTTPAWMREKIQLEEAVVIEHGDVWDEAHAHAVRLAQEKASAYIHPFDHPTIWAGHATLIDETVERLEKPQAVVVAIGGGGLLCGILAGLHKAGWSDVPVLAVETAGAASFAAAVKAGELVDIGEIKTVATSLGARKVAAQALAWTKRHCVIPWIASDRSAVEACLRFADDHRVLVEPACGAALSAVYEAAQPLKKAKSVLVVVCGGAGVTLQKLQEWKAQLV